MDDFEAELEQLRFDKGARIRTLLEELQDRPGAGAELSWQELLDSVRWDREPPQPEEPQRS